MKNYHVPEAKCQFKVCQMLEAQYRQLSRVDAACLEGKTSGSSDSIDRAVPESPVTLVQPSK